MNFPEKDVLSGPGDVWEIAGEVVFTPVGEDGKGDRFFGVAVESEEFGGGNGAVGEMGLKPGHEVAIATAAATNEDFIGEGGQEFLVIKKNRSGGEFGEGGEEVGVAELFVCGVLLAGFEIVCAEEFASGGFGGGLMKEGVSKPAIDKAVANNAARGPSSVCVVGLLMVGELGDGKVEEHVARSSVPAKDSGVEFILCRQERDVANATDVLDGAIACGMGEEGGIYGGD